MDSAASTAFWRIDTGFYYVSTKHHRLRTSPTGSPGPNCNVEGRHKVGHNCVDLVESCEDIYDIGAWIGVLLGENRSQKSCDGLCSQPCGQLEMSWGYSHQAHAHLLAHHLLECILLLWRTAALSGSMCKSGCGCAGLLPSLVHTWKCSRSPGLNSPSILCKATLSGFKRKSSVQKPSDFSPSSSSCRVISCQCN